MGCIAVSDDDDDNNNKGDLGYVNLSSAARKLRLWVTIPRVALLFFSVIFFILLCNDIFCDGLFLFPWRSTAYSVNDSKKYTPTTQSPRHESGCVTRKRMHEEYFSSMEIRPGREYGVSRKL
jgi:hypothetical protein